MRIESSIKMFEKTLPRGPKCASKIEGQDNPNNSNVHENSHRRKND